MTKTKKLAVIPLMAMLILAGGAIAGYASLAGAETTNTTITNRWSGRSPHVCGTITAISGSTITITGMDNQTYIIDATNATFVEKGEASTLSSLAVGDKISVEGTLNGTNISATKVSDCPMGLGGPGRQGKGRGIMGTVSAVNGSTITITNRNGQIYTVDASNATVQKMITASLSDVVVGDSIGIQGDVSGTSVTAKTIMDDSPAPPEKE